MLCERILQTVTIYIYSYSDTERERREREREKAVFLIQETKQLEREKPRKISCKAEEISCQRKRNQFQKLKCRKILHKNCNENEF